MAQDSAPSRPTDLYRFYDRDNRLLYIGISLSAVERAGQHRADKPWWPDIARMEVQHLGTVTRREAEAIERDAIVAEKPKHNVVHNGPTRCERKPPPSPIWICHECGEAILGDGYIDLPRAERRHAQEGVDLAHWRVLHKRCDNGEPVTYWLDISKYRTVDALRRIDEHLSAKRWIDETDWDWIINGALWRAGA